MEATESTLTRVRAALTARDDIVIVKQNEQNYLPHQAGYFSHTCDIFVAPKEGIYEADALQSFMESLVPGLPTSSMDRFHGSERELNFGKLYYDEVIGVRTTNEEVVITASDVQLPDGFVDNKWERCDAKQNVERRTWIRLYPDVGVATLAAGGEHQYSIPWDVLLSLGSKSNESKKTLGQRIRGAIGLTSVI